MHTDFPQGEGEGMITRKTNGSYLVRCGDRDLPCELPAGLRRELELTGGPAELPALGDRVRFRIQSGSAVITARLPRQNQISRRSAAPMPGAFAPEQVIAANIDLAVPVFAVQRPTPKWNLLDRYLVTAEAAGLPALVCITKMDLAGEDPALLDEIKTAAAVYRQIGYPVILTSSATGAGIDELAQALVGKTTVLLGKSGVGKTSLLNALQPGLGLRVKTVIQSTGKGRHTTTHLEMFPLDTGGAVIDTPGVREFGLWDIQPGELDGLFPEMRPYLGRCRFGLNCRHDEEPGCAVRKAVVAGSIDPRRYQSYSRLRAEL